MTSAPAPSFPSDLAIRVEDVGVLFRTPEDRIRSLKEFAIRSIKGEVRMREFWALRGVSFDIRHGETVGIVGTNGCGKSTLFRVIARVMRPATGRVWVRGSLAPVIELGAGFDRDLSGRENVFLYGAILGYAPADRNRWFDEIVAFSELGDFIDSPLRTYSTGMISRLAFSVATAVDAEILLLDEVLSVGDGAFQEKCLARLDEFRQRGTTILIVSHDLASLRQHCSRVVWIDHGKLVADGPAVEITDRYWASLHPVAASNG